MSVTQSLLLLAALSWCGASARGQSVQKELTTGPAKQWAVDAVANELKVLQYDRPYLRYQVHISDAKGDVVRDVVESKDGTVARTIMKEGRPLTPEEDAWERQRLQAMLDSPAAFAKHIKNDQSGKKLAADLIRLLPDAMIFSYAEGQPQRGDKPAGAPAEVILDFKPNPGWTPPGMASEALTGIEGRAWIDTQTHFLTRLEANVFRGVNLGWGVFAHIYPGGSATFEQVRVADDRWIFSHFVEHATVRALMVKTFKENSDVQGSNFSPVAEMSYQDAIHLLMATPLPKH